MGWNKSYDTEDKVWRGRFARHGNYNPDGVGLNEQAAWVEELRAGWFVPVPEIEVKRGRNQTSRSWAMYGRKSGEATISMSALAGAGIVAHEFAHIIAATLGESGHGPLWRRCYVEAVAILLGPWHADRLRRRFEADGLTIAAYERVMPLD